MPRHWICVVNEENWRVVKEMCVWGVSKRRKALMNKVSVGDLMVFYVKPKRIGGIFVVISGPFMSTKRIFSSTGFDKREVFPYRVKLKPLIIPKEPIDFKQLIPKLSFIKNKKMWTGYLRGTMRIIPDEDFNLIKETLVKGAH